MSRGLKSTGRPAADIEADYRAAMDAKACTVSCCFCRWRFAGTVAECREQAAKHRAAKHPDRRQTRRRRGSLQRFTTQDDFRDEGLVKAKEVAEMLRRRDEEAA